MARSVVALLALLLCLPAAAGAQSNAKPVPCPGIEAVDDSPTDARVGFSNLRTPVPAADNQEILQFFWRNEPKNATTRVLTAHLVIKNLDGSNPAPYSFGEVYRLFFTTPDGVRRFIEYGSSTLFGQGFSRGYFSDSGIVSEGPAIGKLWAGPNGVIRVEVASGTAADQPLSDVRWNATTDEGAVIAESDVVPSSGRIEYARERCDPPAT